MQKAIEIGKELEGTPLLFVSINNSDFSGKKVDNLKCIKNFKK